MIALDVVALSLIARAGAYSSEAYQSFARATFSNSRTMTRWGFQSPSMTSCAPALTRNAAKFLYGRANDFSIFSVRLKVVNIDIRD